MDWPLITIFAVIGIFCLLTDSTGSFYWTERKKKTIEKSEAQAVAAEIAVRRRVEMLKLMATVDAINLGVELEHEFRQVDRAQHTDPDL